MLGEIRGQVACRRLRQAAGWTKVPAFIPKEAVMRPILSGVALALVAAPAGAEDPGSKAPKVELVTSQGSLVLELDPVKAPITTENFLRYVRDGHYDGLIFHRVIANFMIQGGGYDTEFGERETREPIRNESRNGLSNERGTIAMARTGDPHSATAQFFINLVDNYRLDGAAGSWGYTVFGRLTDGLDVLDRIGALPTGSGGLFPTDVPVRTVVIEQARVLESD
jgi:peptidyl-prolyl cis-trans isomerase B (cyclophilin B)